MLELLDYINGRRQWLSQFSFSEHAIRELNIIEQKIREMLNQPDVEFHADIYDKEEIHENCTVQVLTNSVTGDVSIGWWQDTAEEIRS